MPASITAGCLAAAAILAACTGGCIPPPAADQPIRLIAEAEDFRVETGPWQVVPFRENYFASTFAISAGCTCTGARSIRGKVE